MFFTFSSSAFRYHKVFPEAKSINEVIDYELIAKAQLRQKGYGIEKNQYNCSLAEIIKDYNVYKEVAYTKPNNFDYVIDRFCRMTGNKVAEEVTLNDLLKYQCVRKKEVKASSNSSLCLKNMSLISLVI